MTQLTARQFEKRILSALSAERLSESQKKVMLASHGIYSRELAKKSASQQEQIADLRVDVEKRNTALVAEQARAAVAFLVNRDNLQRFGNFMIRPISTWSDPQYQLPSSQKEQPAAVQAEIVDVPIVEQDTDLSAEVATDHKKTEDHAVQKSIEGMPWFVRVPTVLLSKIFGDMSPLVAAILIVCSIGGAIAYGIYSRSMWKGNFDAEKERTTQLSAEVDEKNEEISRLKEIEDSYQELGIEKQRLQKSFDETSKLTRDLKDQLSDLRDNHATELQAKEREFAAQLAQFESDATKAFRQREEGHLNRITALEEEKAGLQGQLTDAEVALKEEQASRESLGATEEMLRQQYSEAKDKEREYYRETLRLEKEASELRALNNKFRRSIATVDKIFWASEGFLEERRACFRKYYSEMVTSEAQLAAKYNIPLDMPSGRYNLATDSAGRLRWCHRYYG